MKDREAIYIENILAGKTTKGTIGSFLKRSANPCFFNDLIYPREFGVCNETCPMRMSFGHMNNKCILSRGELYA